MGTVVYAQAPVSGLEQRTLALDIAVSNYYELKELCESNDLPASGTSDEMRSLLYKHFNISPPYGPSVDSSIRIESADSLEYFTLEETSEKLVRLMGPLSVSMTTSDGFIHKISADSIVFDRGSEKVRATGDVLYSRTGNGRTDEYRGESIEVDLGTYSGVFVDGSFDLAPSDSIQRTTTFKFMELVRRGEDVSIFEQVRVTACDIESPHYHIRAKKAWLFSNGDWALSGATLYLGVVPVLWLPFFYYPNDELLVHPVFGYRSREGAFIQTTTYIIGSKPVGTTSSSALSVLSRPAQGTKRVEGLFIRRDMANSSDRNTENPVDYLKVLVDIYSALGTYTGAAGVFGDTAAGRLAFSAGIGISRSLFLQTNGFYSPFDVAGALASQWNSSVLGSITLPFRFGAVASFKLDRSAGPLRYSIAVDSPLFSDPYFEQDFGQRSESYSLLSAFDTNKTSLPKRSAMTQSVTSSMSLNPSTGVSPKLLQNLSLTRLASQLVWKTKPQTTVGLTASERRLLAVDPQREFYYPDTFKLLDLAGSLGGSLFDFGTEAKTSGSLDWGVSGSSTLDWKFLSTGWNTPEAVDYALSYFLAGWRGQGKMGWRVALGGQFLTMAANLSISAQDQTRPYLFDERIAPTSPHPYRLSDYMYRNAAGDATTTFTMSPFRAPSLFSTSSLQYSFGASLFKYRYLELDGSGTDAHPTYTAEWIRWDSEMISAHAITANLALTPLHSPSHRFSFSGFLPPLLEKYAGSYSMDYKYIKLSLQGAVSRVNSSTDLQPSSLGGRITIGADPFPVLTSDVTWDFLANEPSSNSSSLRYKWARIGFNAKKAKGYVFSGGAWNLDGTDSFRPYDFSISLSPRYASNARDELKLDARSTLSYAQNLVRFTESKLAAAFELSLTNKQGTALSFSSSSSNRSAWRYWPGLFRITDDFDPRDYGRSILSDLFDSFSLWDAARLRNGLFKLESMKLKLAQDLHDWTLAASLGMDPVLVTPESGRSYYELDFSFSFSVAWKDIPEIKSSLTYTKGQFEE